MGEEERPKVHPRAGDAEVLALAEGLVAALGKVYVASDLLTLRDVVESYPDQGRDGSADVVASLVGLLDDLIAREELDKDALRVHVHAWRFFVSRRPDKKERLRLLEGLRAVWTLYEEKAA